jgi:glycyl-tRNA synthetase beta chain
VARFAAVTNTDDRSAKEIARGMERVVVARLRDAAFFYAEDLKRPLVDRVADLSGVTFHRGLGTYADKAKRLVSLVDAFGGPSLALLSDAQSKDAAEGARLAKADLTTLMVREFPELQGTMGGIYLEAQGAPRAVATAVRWHYALGATGPAADTGLPLKDLRVVAAVSLADKLDTLAGYFAIDLAPSGSSDPFGLRRAAQGVVRILLDFWQPAPGEARPDLMTLMDRAASGYAPGLKIEPKAVLTSLHPFLRDRLAFVLGEWGSPDEVEAVMGTPDTTPSPLKDVLDTRDRLQALHKVRQQAPDDFAHLAVAFKRAKNILTQQAAAPSVEPALFENDAERELHKAVASLGGLNGDYDARLKSLSALRAPVDRFFDDVHVMAEDPKVRGNRLALLNQTLSLFYRIADISKLGGQS